MTGRIDIEAYKKLCRSTPNLLQSQQYWRKDSPGLRKSYIDSIIKKEESIRKADNDNNRRVK